MTSQSDIAQYRHAVAGVLHEHWVLYLIEGIALIVFGVLAIVIPPLATLAFTLLLGWLFLLSGAIGLVTTLWMRRAPGFWWSLLSALLGIVVGVMLLAAPPQGALSLTLVLIAFFVVEGVASIMFALDHKRELSGRWGWMLVSGMVDLVLSALILAGLPSTAAWAIGLMVGINMVFGGAALAAMALHARSPPSRRVSANASVFQFSLYMIATARVQPAEPPRTFTGKQLTMKPLAGKASRLCSFSMWQ